MGKSELLRREIELIEKLCADSATFSKNKILTPTHRESCREENVLFTSILRRLKQIAGDQSESSRA